MRGPKPPKHRGRALKRKPGGLRDPSTYPDLHGMSLEQLVEHRELQALRNPCAERYSKLADAKRMLAEARGEGSAAAAR